MEADPTTVVGLSGLAAVLIKQYGPAIKALLASLLSKAGQSGTPDVDDVGAVLAYNAIRGRLTEGTAKTVWAEIEPKQEAKP